MNGNGVGSPGLEPATFEHPHPDIINAMCPSMQSLPANIGRVSRATVAASLHPLHLNMTKTAVLALLDYVIMT